MSDLPPDVAARLEQSRMAAIRAAREGVLLTPRPVRHEEEPRSYMGGLPHLREDLEWPVSTTNGRPLTFIAQIDLRDVPRPAGVFFPAEGLLWFFADLSEEEFGDEHHTRVLFDPHPKTMARAREAPADLPPLDPYDHYGWLHAQHPRAFIGPKARLLLDLVDTFYDHPYRRPSTWEDFFRIVLTPWHKREKKFDDTDFGAGVYSGMIGELRKEAVHRAIAERARNDSAWLFAEPGHRGAHWPATSIEAEYALMNLAGDYRLSPTLEDHPCTPEARAELGARLRNQIRILRDSGPRPLAQSERAAIKALVEIARRGFGRFDLHRHPGTRMRHIVRDSRRSVDDLISRTYPYAAFEILSTMPDAERYVPKEMLDPYGQWSFAGPLYFHQMFGHATGLQGAPQVYEHEGFVLLLQIVGFATMGLVRHGETSRAAASTESRAVGKRIEGDLATRN